MIQFYPEGLADIKFSCLVDQDLSEVGVDSPVPHLIGIGQGISGDFPPYAHVIEFVLGPPETGLNISQAFPVGQLGKRHAEKLVPAGEAYDLVVAVVSCDALAELVGRDKVH